MRSAGWFSLQPRGGAEEVFTDRAAMRGQPQLLREDAGLQKDCLSSSRASLGDIARPLLGIQ